jgi:rubrerythrin
LAVIARCEHKYPSPGCGACTAEARDEAALMRRTAVRHAEDAASAYEQLRGAVDGFEAEWRCPNGHRFRVADAASPKWCPGCGTSTLTRVGGQ